MYGSNATGEVREAFTAEWQQTDGMNGIFNKHGSLGDGIVLTECGEIYCRRSD